MNGERQNTPEAPPVLELIGATKSYQGAHALAEVDFDLRPGEVHALVGENGAGKSTLCKALAGAIPLSAGEFRMDGRPVTLAGPGDALARGIAMVYQETSLVAGMSVAQNIELGHERFFNSLRRLNIRAQQTLQSLNFDINPTLPVALLGAAQRQMVEIARAVVADARIIIFDEPTASLSPEETQTFFDLVATLRRKGLSIVFISHALEEALTIADRITVLRDGRKVVTDAASRFDRDRLVRAMVGRTPGEKITRRTTSPQITAPREKVLEVENVVGANLVQNMSFSVYAGEVTGMAGLVGSGRTEIAQIIAGVQKRRVLHGGMIYYRGRPVRYRVPRQAINDGIVYVTEDRKVNGFFETMNAADNIYLGWLATRLGWRFLISPEERRRIGADWAGRVNIRALSGTDSTINEMSGGNQQKVVIAKSLVQQPGLVIFDEPTKGVDVGTIPQIHGLIRELAESGVAVIVTSSYLPEILTLSDRILVAQQGRIAEEFSPEEATEEKIMFAAVH